MWDVWEVTAAPLSRAQPPGWGDGLLWFSHLRGESELKGMFCVSLLRMRPKSRPEALKRGLQAGFTWFRFSYGLTVWSGITDTQLAGGVRSGAAGTRLDCPGARASSAAREQFPSGMFHQLLVIG